MKWVLDAAYGRKYKTPEAAMADWHAGKDFRIAAGPAYVGSYCSKRDEDAMRQQCKKIDLLWVTNQRFKDTVPV